MNYATIKYYDIANGVGVRTSLFVSGCTHHCKSCFNSEVWDFAFGEPFTDDIARQIIDSCAPGFVSGLSLLGGEPMEPVNQRALLPFLREFRAAYPQKTVWCYSGYTYEELTGEGTRCRCEVTDALLSCIDVLVDGRFVEELHDITLHFRGSSNQRIIDMARTRAAGAVTLWEDDPVFANRASL